MSNKKRRTRLKRQGRRRDRRRSVVYGLPRVEIPEAPAGLSLRCALSEVAAFLWGLLAWFRI